MRKELALAACLAALTLAAFWPVLENGFVTFDDDIYVTENPYVQGGLTVRGLAWAFTTTAGANWHPLTWVSHMADCSLYKLNPIGHHLTNLLIHTANTLLLFAVLRLLTGAVWRSAAVAALFAVHPLHTESVAWVAERKDVLSTLFWMLALLAYGWYARRVSWKRYALLTGAFVLGLMSKPMLVSLPLVLLVMDYWPMRRTGKAPRRLLLEKLPLLALAAASCLATVFAQKAGGALVNMESCPVGIRAANALVAYVSYLGRTVWPHDLAAFYPHPGAAMPAWWVAGSALLLVAISVSAIVLRKTAPYLLAGWLWYAITLVPVIGLVQVGNQAMADRYTYVPLIGIFFAAAWGANDLMTRFVRVGTRRRAASGAAAAIVLMALVSCTRVQASYWHDGVTLFSHALKVTKANHIAHVNLGVALDREGRLDEAISQFRAALRSKPSSALIHYNMAFTLERQMKHKEAIAHYREALRVAPTYAEAHYNLGLVLDGLRQTREAIREYRQAVQLQRGYTQARNNLAIDLYSVGDYGGAWQEVSALREAGFEPHPGFIEALSEAMPDPSER